jgi:hypothetical protein
VSYRPVLTGRALGQFNDFIKDKRKPTRHSGGSCCGTSTRHGTCGRSAPSGDDPEFRETQFGEHGLVSFRVDDDAEQLVIFNIVWAG